MASSLAVVWTWSDLAQASDFEGAAALMAEDVVIQSPLKSFTGKDRWMEEIPKIMKQGIEWTPFEQGSTENQVTCDGSKDMGVFVLTVTRTIEVNDDGKISSIVVKKK